MKVSRKCLRVCAWIGIVTYVHLLLAGHGRLQQQRDNNMLTMHRDYLMLESELSTLHIQPCTFEQLYQAFPPETRRRSSSPRSSNDDDDDDEKDCWKLHDEIVRVPADRIINRNHLTPLGSGIMGGVHKAIVNLDNNRNHHRSQLPSKLCTAAIKTDHCHSWWPFRLYKQRARSCIEMNSYLWRPRSYIGAEYTAALVWYAQQKLSNNKNRTSIVPGLLPTWGIIQDREYPINSPAIRHEHLQRYPHPDPTVIGVIMPLQGFRSVSDILSSSSDNNNNNNKKKYSSAQLAKIMLPAATGLEFVGSVGLAFRDLLEKNVGILDSTGEGIVFDNSYMGVKQPEDCHSVACKYCHEDVFPQFDDHFHHDIKGIPRGHDYIQGDMNSFRKVILKLAEQCPDKARAELLSRDMLYAQNIQELVQVLTKYSADTAA